MGFVYTVVRDQPKQESSLQLQVRVESASPFINNMVSSESYKRNNFCGHVGDMVGDSGDGGRFGEVADEIFNDFYDDISDFDDNLQVFLI